MKRLLCVIASALLAVTTALAVSSPADFTRAYLAVLKKQAPKIDVKITGDLELKVIDENKHEQTVYLNNAYDTYKQSPDDGHNVLERYIAATLEGIHPSQEPPQCDQIVPIIKDRAWLEEIQNVLADKLSNPKKIDQVWEDYNGELLIFYAQDSPKNIRYLTSDDLPKLGLKREELRSLAVTNLRKLLPDIKIHGSPQLYMMTAGGTYEASLLLAEGIWKDGQIKVEGEIVVAVPARDMLLITGSKDSAGLVKIRQLANKTVKDAPYRLTDQLFVLRDGKFIPYVQ